MQNFNKEFMDKYYPTTGNKLMDKIIFNSYLPLFANDYFIMYDENVAKEITEEGNKVIKNLEK